MHRRALVLIFALPCLLTTAGAAPARPIHLVAYAQWDLPPGQYRARDNAHYNAQGYSIVVARMLPQVEALIARAAHR